MCGIFGLLAAAGVDQEKIEQLGNLNRARGNRGFGLLMGNERETAVFRTSSSWHDTYQTVSDTVFCFAHLRAPTGPTVADFRAIHPIYRDQLYLAHNGILLNSRRFPEWAIYPELSFDSQTILGGIVAQREELGLVGAICATVGQLEGQQACWLWDEKEGALYLWRVMSPIYYEEGPEQFLFSSIEVGQLLPEGVLFRVGVGQQMEKVGRFPYYSPYKILSKS